MTVIQSINPYSGELNAEFELFTDEIIDKKISKANSAYLEWKNTSFYERKKLFYKLADVLEENIEEYAKLQTIEMWMLYSASIWWLKWTIKLIKWFADNAEEVLQDEEFNTNWTTWKYIYDPLGVIFWIWPWNFPFAQILRAAVPNIIGCNNIHTNRSPNPW